MPILQKKWPVLQNAELSERVESIVLEVANRIRKIETVREVLQGELGSDWRGSDLLSGFSGICLLYGELHRFDPHAGWDLVGHKYLLAMQQSTTEEIASLSLGAGLTGMGFAVQSLSCARTRYQGYLQQVQDLFLNTYRPILTVAKQRVGMDVRMLDYDALFGFAGVARALLFWVDQPMMREALCEILEYLVMLSQEQVVNGRVVPGWYISVENQMTPSERAKYPHGHFNLGVAHGIVGPLAVLAVAIQAGVEVPGMREAVRRIGSWVRKWMQEDADGPYWGARVSWEDQQSGKFSETKNREAWCYGSPGVARVMWLAGQAIGESEWQQVAVETYLAIASRTEQEWNLDAPNLCHGYAGLLQMTQRMYADSNHLELLRLRDQLVEKMISMFDPTRTFGYYDVLRNDEGTWVRDLPGLLEGATGAALALAGCIQPEEPEWDAFLLIR